VKLTGFVLTGAALAVIGNNTRNAAAIATMPAVVIILLLTFINKASLSFSKVLI
jgi:hypothetical protein